MVNSRPYREALSPEEAVRIIREEAGTKFDPHLVEVFVQHIAGEMQAARDSQGSSGRMSYFVIFFCRIRIMSLVQCMRA
jgi:HD-GYP domain-containing protein (c-di-GMP phosphodiesterase class II)